MKKLLIPFILAGAVACSTVKTAFDYDKQADFSKYKTYRLSEGDLKTAIGELNANRVIEAVESELAAKGLMKAEDPNVLIDIHIKTQQKVSATANTTGSGMGYGRYTRYGYGGGFSTTQISYDEYTDGTLFITMIDNVTQKIVWQGTGSKTLDENAGAAKRESTIAYSIKQILLNYPPKK